LKWLLADSEQSQHGLWAQPKENSHEKRKKHEQDEILRWTSSFVFCNFLCFLWLLKIFAPNKYFDRQ